MIYSTTIWYNGFIFKYSYESDKDDPQVWPYLMSVAELIVKEMERRKPDIDKALSDMITYGSGSIRI